MKLKDTCFLNLWRSFTKRCLKNSLYIPFCVPCSFEDKPKQAMTNLNSILKSRDITLSTKVLIDKAPFFSSSHVRMWELDHIEGLAPKNWCFQTVLLEKTLENILDSKEIKLVKPKGNQPWIFIGRTDAKVEAETPILWPPDAKNGFVGKNPDDGKD